MDKDNKTVQSILKSAKTEFAEKGLAGARMDSIAKRAEVNQALLYYYFGSKDNLFLEILKRILSIQDRIDLTEFAMRYALDPSQHLYAMIYLILILHLEETDSEIDRIIIHAFELEKGKNEFFAQSEKYFLPLFQRIDNIIFEGINSGEFEIDDPYLFVTHIFYFIMFYGNDRVKLHGTQFYDRVYGQDYKTRAISFLMSCVFKILQPGSDTFQMPVLPISAMRELDSMIETMIEQFEKEWKKED